MFPDFLGIGAQKSGTTWLYQNLAAHPQVWMPPVKELHYLDHKPQSLPVRLMSRKNFLRKAKVHLRQNLIATLKGEPEANLDWAMRYCLARRTDEWYGALFPKIEGKISGEVCPGYARVGLVDVERVHRLMPNAKVIYLIRNPVERAWSALAMHFRKPRFGEIAEYSEEAITARFDSPRSQRHCAYSTNIDGWEKYYPDNQMLVGFFDDLERDPRYLLKTILEFLGIDAGDDVISASVGERRNPGRSEVIPPAVERFLAQRLIDEVRSLHARFDNKHTQGWLDDTEALL